MHTELDPVVGNWYRQTDKDLLFRVVAFDEEHDLVEIQHFDGELEEFDASVWFEMEIESAEAPEDWVNPLDDTDEVPLGRSPSSLRGADWEDLNDTDAEADEDWGDEPPEDEGDEWGDGDLEDAPGPDSDR